MILPDRLAARLAQGLDKPLAVGVVVENRFAQVTTVHNLVHSTGLLNPKFARHTLRRNPVRQSRCQAPIDE